KLAFTTQADSGRDPARVMTAMNRLLSVADAHAFVTAIYVVFDVERHVMTVANAGHPGLLIGRASGIVDEVENRGLMIGVREDATYLNTVVEMCDGDTVLMYTDGVTDAQNRAGEYFDADRVRRWLTAGRKAAATEVAAGAVRDLRGWRGQNFFE